MGWNASVVRRPSGACFVNLRSRTTMTQRDTAATPMELLVLGLAGCTGVDVVTILERMREPLEGLEVNADFERAETQPPVYTKIHLTYKLKGGLDEAKVRRAIELSETKYCSVSAMLSPAIDISHDFVIED